VHRSYMVAVRSRTRGCHDSTKETVEKSLTEIRLLHACNAYGLDTPAG